MGLCWLGSHWFFRLVMFWDLFGLVVWFGFSWVVWDSLGSGSLTAWCVLLSTVFGLIVIGLFVIWSCFLLLLL